MNEKNSPRERYLDAAAEVFMEQYGMLWEASVLKEADEVKHNDVPPSLDQRCLSLIQKEAAKVRRKERQKNFLRAISKVAVVLAVLLGTFSVLFMTVEAIRVPIMNLFIEFRDTYMIVSTQKQEDLIVDAYNAQDPLHGLVPEDYEFIRSEGNPTYLYAEYQADKGYISLFVFSSGMNNTVLDTEDAEVTYFRMQEHDVIMIVSEKSTVLFWKDSKNDIEVTLLAVGVSERTALSIAEDLVLLYENTSSPLPVQQFYKDNAT